MVFWSYQKMYCNQTGTWENRFLFIRDCSIVLWHTCVLICYFILVFNLSLTRDYNKIFSGSNCYYLANCTFRFICLGIFTYYGYVEMLLCWYDGFILGIVSDLPTHQWESIVTYYLARILFHCLNQGDYFKSKTPRLQFLFSVRWTYL